MAVDQDGGRAEGQRAEMRAEELDFALRQAAGARCRRCGDRGGLRGRIVGVCAAWSGLNPMRVKESRYVLRMLHPKHTTRRRHHRVRCPNLREGFPADERERLGDVEEAEKGEADKAVVPIGGQKSRAIQTPATSSMTTNWGSLRPDSRATMVAAGCQDQGEGDPDKETDERGVGAGMAEECLGCPKEKCGDRAPGAGAGFAETGAEEGGYGPGPARLCRALIRSSGRLNLHGVDAFGVAATEGAEVFEDFWSRMGS